MADARSSLDNGGYDRSLLIEDGQLAVFYEAGCSVITSLRENRWQHVAAVFLEGEICIYKDGIEVAKLKEYPQEEGDNYAIAHLGGSPNRMEYFRGLMDEVVILPFALASSGVKLAYGELAPITHAANGQLAEDESKSGEDGIFSLDSGIPNQQSDEGEAAESFARQKIDAEPAGPVEDQAYSTDLAASELSMSSAAKDTNSGDQPSISYSLGGPFSKLLHLPLPGKDPKQVAEILQKERWDNPVALQRTEFSLPDSVYEDGKSWRGARLLDFRYGETISRQILF